MAQWVPNPIYGDPNGGDYIDDLGQVHPDPQGVLNPQAAAPGMQTTPAGAADFLGSTNQTGRPMGPPMAPEAHVDPAQAHDDSRMADLQQQISAPDPAQVRGSADRMQSPGPPDPAQVRGSSNAPAMLNVSQTTTDRTDSRQGPSKETKANIESATGAANAAEDASGQAQINQLNATADLERKQATDGYARGVNQYFQAWGQRQVQDQIVRDTSARLDEASQFKPDRAQLFSGDHGVLFGIASAVAAMAGGWMMGRHGGGQNPFLPSILKMIDDNANDQIAQNSSVMRELTRRLGSAEAAQKELKARMLGAVEDTINSQTRFEKADLVQKGAASVLAQVGAAKAKNQLDAAKLTGDTVTHQVQSRTQNQLVPNPQAFGGVNVSDPKEYARVGKVADLSNFASEAQSLAKSGTLASNVGFIDGKWNWVKGAFNARDPGQARVEALRSRWELLNRADWASEPNGQETQARLSQIDFPQNDQEIPLFIQRVNEVMNSADPGGRYRFAAKAMGQRPNAVEVGRVPVVHGK